MIITCIQCGKEFKDRYSSNRHTRFCSKKCSGIAHSIIEYKNCLQCGIKFRKRNGKRLVNKFCGRKCFDKNKLGKPHPAEFWSKATEEQKLERFKKNFNKRVLKKENGCWDWKGFVVNKGYPYISYEKKPFRASRASWIIHYGKIPEGLNVLHKCDNPRCTNPAHLFLGTHKDNTQDMMKKGRCGCIGEKNWGAKLTIDKVREIRQLLNSSHTITSLAQRFNVSNFAIHQIKYNRTWKGV